ncbi:recombination-associated protein RdgC [Pseudoxanthomonas sp. USHLN014]|uniref:recombination-associated protein RdgC n=1 Tax=Pseudoxanthomonas sp. USHLN014 TaxID=3081297 RepID=UPI00301B8F93
MFFRNLNLYRLPRASTMTFGLTAAEAFEGNRLQDVGPLEFSSVGFVSPYGRDSDILIAKQPEEGARWFAIGTQTKLLPAAVLNEKLARRLDEIEARDGRRPGGKTRKRLRDDILHELLPTAMVLAGRIDAMLLPAHNLLVVDSGSRKGADAVVSQVRAALGSFPALPISSEISPRRVLTGWVSGDPLPYGLTLGEACELRDPIEGGAIVRCRQQDLASDEITRHLEAGKQVTRLEMTLADSLSFVLGEDLVIRQLRFLDGALDLLEDVDDQRAELDARFALQAGEIACLFGVLEEALRLNKEPQS